jgi:hypothetical protein
MRRTASSSDFYINSAIRFSICRPSLDDERNFRHQTFSRLHTLYPPFFVKFSADYPHLFKSLINQPIGNYAVVMAQVISKVWSPPQVSIYMSSISHFAKLSFKWEMGSWTLPALQNRFYVNFKRTDIDNFAFFSPHRSTESIIPSSLFSLLCFPI